MNKMPGFEYLEIISLSSPKNKIYVLNVFFLHAYLIISSHVYSEGNIPEMLLLNVERRGIGETRGILISKLDYTVSRHTFFMYLYKLEA